VQFEAHEAGDPLSLLNTHNDAAGKPTTPSQQPSHNRLRRCNPVPYGGTIPKRFIIESFDYVFFSNQIHNQKISHLSRRG
jgi:hypothetical protein